MFLLSPKHSHQEELNERLSFLQEFAVNSDFQISKAQLTVIYDLLSQSPIQSDFSEFLNWCNTACKAQTAASPVLDLEEVGDAAACAQQKYERTIRKSDNRPQHDS